MLHRMLKIKTQPLTESRLKVLGRGAATATIDLNEVGGLGLCKARGGSVCISSRFRI